MWHLLITCKVLTFTNGDVVSASIVGMSPSLVGFGIHSDLMFTDALHAYNDSRVAVIQLGQRIACL
jgi:hypothetical protein